MVADGSRSRCQGTGVLYQYKSPSAIFLMDEEVFAFGSFRLVPAQRVLLEDGKPLRLGSRALDILITLVEHAGETISKEQLIAHTWPQTVIDDGALRVHVAALRKALRDGRAGKRYVANNPGRGYAFVAPVTREHALSATALPNGAAQGNQPAGPAHAHRRPRRCHRRIGNTARSPSFRRSFARIGRLVAR